MKKEDSGVMSPLLMYLSVSFAAALIIANVLANRLILVGPWVVDAGTLIFPVTYIISDVLSEVYGYKWSRRVAWTSLALNAFFALMVIIVVRIPAPDGHGLYFANALSNSWRIVVASLTAFCLGDLVDDRIFRRLREINRKKYNGKENMRGFAFRALFSSLVGHILDTNIFVFIAFAPFAFLPDTGISWGMIPGMILLNIIIKWACEWLVIPVTFKVTKWVSAYEDNN
jgi:uncharacterized integral membrane protein (TIGR00697 family)